LKVHGLRDVYLFALPVRARNPAARAVPRRRERRPSPMSDLLEEQAMEVEALESILMDDMHIVEGSEGISGATHAPCYQIAISALGDGEEEDQSDAKQTARLGLVFSHTPNYPEEPPLLRCRSIEGLFDQELDEIQRLLTKRASESVGMSMVFDLVNDAKEWMRGRAGVVDVLEETPEMLQRRLEYEAEERLKAMRAVGTAVTVETFNAWVKRFEKETGAVASAETAERRRASRMTGRKYFETVAASAEDPSGDEEEDERANGAFDADGSDSGDESWSEDTASEDTATSDRETDP